MRYDGHLAARYWLPALAIGLPAWWSMIGLWPASRAHFFVAGTPDAALAGFFVGDLLLIELPTLFAARQLRVDPGAARWTAWLVTGALAYVSLGCLGSTLLAWDAPLAPLLMLPCAFVQAVVAWTLQPRERWFRVAAPGTVWSRAAKTVGDAALFTGTFLLIVPALLRVLEDRYGLYRFDGWPWLAAGIPALALAGLGAGLQMVRDGDGTPLPVDTARVLVVRGAYAHIRNPMAATGIAQGLLLAIAAGSPLLFAYALVGGLFWHTFVRPIEEEDLERRFGEPYERYRNAVPLWWPTLTPYRG